MATSGSTDFTLSRSEIIDEVLAICNVVGSGETPSPEDIAKVNRTLNIMLKAWQKTEDYLWLRTEATIMLVYGQASYSLPGAKGSNTVIKTELGAAEAAGQTVITVDSTAGMTASDVVLIELDSGALHASTISSVDNSTTITIADATSGAASIDNHVYTYTTAIGRPLSIESIRLRDLNGNDRPLNRYSRQQYFDLPDKNVVGTPIAYYYDSKLSTGKLYLYPTPDTVKSRLEITYTRTIEDMDSASNTLDMPVECLEAVIWNCALRCAPQFEVDRLKIEREIAPIAFQALAEMRGGDVEDGSIYIEPTEE